MNKLQINRDIQLDVNDVVDVYLPFLIRSTWQRVSAVRLFIEHTCPGTLACHPADVKNAFKLWKVRATITLQGPWGLFLSGKAKKILQDTTQAKHW